MSNMIPTVSVRRLKNLIPKPVHVEAGAGEFQLTESTKIVLDPSSGELSAAAQFLVSLLRPVTALALEISPGPAGPGDIFALLDEVSDLGEEGYELTVTPQSVHLQANRPAGLFYALQTLRQLLPPLVEAALPQPGPWTIPVCQVRDAPRFAGAA